MISIGSNRDNVTYGIKHYIVDTPEDLQKLSRTKKMGCTCFVIKSSKYYMLNGDQEWVEITPFGAVISSDNEEDNLLLSNFLSDNFDESAEELVNINKVDGRIKVSSLKKLNTTVEKNPDAAVNVIRSWLYNNEA
jgi:hypothetical protein